jgi:hypothetical protein
MACTVAVTLRSLLVGLRDLYPIRGHISSSIDREEFIMRWNFLVPGIDSQKNLQHEGMASIDVPKYNEFGAGAED